MLHNNVTIETLQAENQRLKATLAADKVASEELVAATRAYAREARAKVKEFRAQCHAETHRLELECAAAIQALEKENETLRGRSEVPDTFDRGDDRQCQLLLQEENNRLRPLLQSLQEENNRLRPLLQSREQEILARYEMLYPALNMQNNVFRSSHRQLFTRVMLQSAMQDPYKKRSYQLVIQFLALVYEEKKNDSQHKKESKLIRALNLVGEAYFNIMMNNAAFAPLTQIQEIHSLANYFNPTLANVVRKIAGIFIVAVGASLLTACVGLTAATAGISLPVTLPITLAISSLLIKTGFIATLGLGGATVTWGGISFFKQVTPEISQSCTAMANHLRPPPAI